MKALIAIFVILTSLNTFARSYSTFSDIREEACPDMYLDYREDVAYCKAENAKLVINAKVGAQLTKAEVLALKFSTWGAVDAGIVPDDSSSTAYFYTRWLVDMAGKKVGVITIEGWFNTEMEDSSRFYIRYNLKGQTVKFSAEPM